MANNRIADERKKVRLIDANALIKDIDNYYHNSPFPHPGTTWLRGLELAVGLILKATTVDAVEVVHGRWEFSHTTAVEKFDVVKCSNCGHEAFAIAFYVQEGHYCPTCGAKNDGERKDNG